MENINFELYKIFYYVAINKNVTKASKILSISQPAITQTIHKLEEQLNYKLFYRTSRGVELTNHGEKLFNHIKNSIECINTSKYQLDNYNNNKVLKIGSGSTLLKYNALKGVKAFIKDYPDVKLEITRGITNDLFTKLNDNTLDLVIFNMPTTINENLVYEKIEEIEDIFIADTKQFGYLKNKKITGEELSKLPFVLQSDVSSSRKYLNSICKKNHIKLINKYELESYDLVISFVKAGLGIGFVNKRHVEEELKNNDIFELNIIFSIPNREIGIAYNRKNINNKYIEQFIKELKK